MFLIFTTGWRMMLFRVSGHGLGPWFRAISRGVDRQVDEGT